jgi:hypothetical protein
MMRPALEGQNISGTGTYFEECEQILLCVVNGSLHVLTGQILPLQRFRHQPEMERVRISR